MTPTVVSPGVVEQVRMAVDEDGKETGSGIVMHARKIRLNHATGVHGDVYIYGLRPDGTRKFLAETDINLTKDDQRTKILNKARKQATPEWEELLFGHPKWKVVVTGDFDEFCLGIEDILMAVEAPKEVPGNMSEPMKFLAKPLVLQHSGTIMFGPGGAGKSTVAMLAGIAIDAGKNGLWETMRTKVLYGNLERSPESIVRRIFAVNTALGLPYERPLAVITARGKGLSSIEPIIRKYITENGIGLFILDSISRAGMGKLTDDDTANMTIDILNSFGIAWLAIGHTSKENANETFGSVHYGNGADITVKLTAEKRGALETGVRLETMKANDIAFPPPMTLALTFDRDYGLHTAKIAGPEDYPELAKDTRSLPQKIHDYLVDERGKASATEIAEALKADRSGVSRILNADERFISFPGQGREVLYAVKAVV